MIDAIGLTADIVTIVGVLMLFAFLLNHPVTKSLGVWAGALRDPHPTYGWKRRQRGGRRKWRVAVDWLLSPLSRLGGETRQPMKPTESTGFSDDTFREEMKQRLEEQRAREQHLMEEAGARIAVRRWRRGHRRTRCEECRKRFRDTLLLCMEDCSWNESHPKHLRHRCQKCLTTRDADDGQPIDEAADSSQPLSTPSDPSPPEQA